MAYQSKKSKIPVWLIVVGFMFGFWPGAILLAIHLMQDREEQGTAKYTRKTGETSAAGTRTYNVQGQRTYQPPRAQTGETLEDFARRMVSEIQEEPEQEKTIRGGMNADGTYRYSYTQPEERRTTSQRVAQNKTPTGRTTVTPPKASASLLDDRKLRPKIGKGLRLAGNIVMGCGAFAAAVTFLSLLMNGSWIGNVIGVTSMVGLCICVPGLVLSIIGNKKHNRIMRCRTYATMIGSRRCVSIKDLAAAIPTRFSKCQDDLQWMLSEGLLPGMYIDGTAKTLTFGDAAPAETKSAQPEGIAELVRPGPNGEKIYPEEAHIHRLNARIDDQYVSDRMERLEELTHKILAYAEEHPEKESHLRQFRNHYLPKTFSILESYARMERMGVEGGNIGAAMKDVEDIMDKLVLGFEKQLDALFDSEALDVTSDISVLENMMTMEGLSDLDPFGSMAQKTGNETWSN